MNLEQYYLDRRNSWFYKKTTQGLEMEPHWHTHYEILLMHSGSGEIFSCGQTIPFTSPCILLYKPFIPHRLHAPADRPYTRSMLYFTHQHLKVLTEQLLDLSFLGDASLFFVPLQKEQEAALDGMFQALFANVGEFAETHLYIALITNTLRRIAEQNGIRAVDNHRLHYLSDVLMYLSENLNQRLTLDGVAEQFGIGRSKLNNDLRAVTGYSFKEHLTELRLIRAKEMLEYGSTVTQASLECGYSHESHFIAVYRDRWGCTPGQTFRRG